MNNEKCKVCGTELLPPRYKFDQGLCRDCYKKKDTPQANAVNSKEKLYDEGDECPKCGTHLKNIFIGVPGKWGKRIIICPVCEHKFRDVGSTNQTLPA